MGVVINSVMTRVAAAALRDGGRRQQRREKHQRRNKCESGRRVRLSGIALAPAGSRLLRHPQNGLNNIFSGAAFVVLRIFYRFKRRRVAHHVLSYIFASVFLLAA